MSAQNLDSLSNKLLEGFKETFKGQHFKIGSLKINKENENTPFEIDIIPEKEGVYFIKQTFEFEEGWGYKNNSILNIIKAGKKEDIRYFNGIEPNASKSFTCAVGDTIIIPIYWNKHIVNSEFSIGEEQEREIYGKIDTKQTSWKNEERQLDWSITNTIDELKVKDVISSYAIHRHLRDESVSHSIQFEAIKTGEFILEIGTFKLPIVIYPKEATIRKKVTQVVGKQWSDRANSYSLPEGYNKNIEYALLRVGDIITLPFLSYVQNVKNPLEIDLNINIEKTK